MRTWCAAVCSLLLVESAQAANALAIRDGQLRYWGRAFEVWGVELADWRRVADDDVVMRQTFQRLSDHGVNTVGYALQQPGAGDPFFDAQGNASSQGAGARLGRMTRLVRDHHLASVVGLFSAERSQWLESAEAYRRAAATAARLVNEKHSVIFIVGDAFGAGRWAEDCPYPMNDPARVLELCEIVKKANPELMIGLRRPRGPGDHVAAGAPALFHVGEAVDPLRPPPVPAERPSGAMPEAVNIMSDRFLLLSGPEPVTDAAVERYLKRVEQRRLTDVGAAAVATGPAADEPLTPQEKASGWVALFDGRTLNGWTTLHSSWDGWSVRDGVIYCAGTSGQWLRTRERYGSFVLRFEYRIIQGGNSGVFAWSPLEGRSSRFGMEMQIRGVIKEKPDDDTTGAIYDVLPPRVDASRPAGEWNEVEITCRGSRVTIMVNGVVVQDIDADEVPKLRDRLRRGVIGLQDHGDETWFRRIRIKALDQAGACRDR